MSLNEILLFFSKQIEAKLGIIYSDHNYYQLQNRLQELAKRHGFSSLEEVYAFAQKGASPTFQQDLFDLATNNETSFFRDFKVFNALESLVLPQLLNTPPAPLSLNIWSAASSTGQEPLSVAMTLLEWSQKNARTVNFKVNATDISERVLERAKKFQYSQLEVQRGLPAPLLLKYFQKDEFDRWTANSLLQSRIDYSRLNLKETFPHRSPFHIVLCRNVLIYQSIEGKKDILKRIADVLVPGGFLILGSGESLMGLSESFDLAPADGAIVYRRKVPNQAAA